MGSAAPELDEHAESATERVLRRIFLVDGSASNLAVVRIVCCAAALLHLRPDRAVQRATVDAPLRPPDVSGWLLELLPRNEVAVTIVVAVMSLALVSALVGHRTRTSLAVGAVSALYVVGLAQSFGKVDHVHHMVLALVILAASPCGDALSLDARRAMIPPNRPAYGVPVRMIWLVIGVAYFSAGYWKLASAGLEWALSDNLRNIMWFEWSARGGYEPVVFIADQPTLLRALGVLAIVFELGVGVALFTRLRPIAAIGGLAFHTGIGLTMGITFTSLMLVYPVFFDWTSTVARYRAAAHRLWGPPSADRRRLPERTSDPPLLVGGIVAMSMLLAATTHTLDGWPVASYPDFGYLVPDEIIRYDLVDDRDTDRAAQALPQLSSLQRFRLLRHVARNPDQIDDLAQVVAPGACAPTSIEIVLTATRVQITDRGLVDGELIGRQPVVRCR